MNMYKKSFSVLLFLLFLFVALGNGHASAFCYETRNSFSPVLKEVRLDSDGNLLGYVKLEPAYSEYMDLLVKNDNGRVISRIPVDSITKTTYEKANVTDRQGKEVTIELVSGEFKISRKDLALESGEYLVSLEVSNFSSNDQETTNPLGISMVTTDVGCGKHTLTSEEQTIIFPKMKFPGELKVINGAIQIMLQLSSETSQAKFYLAIMDDHEKVMKRITINPKNPKIPSNSLDLPAGEYILRLQMITKSDEVYSKEVTLIIPAADIPNSTRTTSGDAFPGAITISKDGTVQINITLTSELSKAKFYLLILNEKDQVVKRIAINLKNPRISLAGYYLSSGSYRILIEMVQSGKKTQSEPVVWRVPNSSPATAGFPIPSGQNFPGTVKVNANGSITITLQWQSTYAEYEVYLLVSDLFGNVVKRIPIDPRMPSASLKELHLSTGGYTLVIEVVDPHSGLSATSTATFLTVNETNNIIVFIDGQLQTFTKKPVEINGRTLVPLRAIFEALGATVEWDEATQTVTATKDGNTISLTIGSKVAYKNGKKINLDVPAQLFNGDTTMVPIRFVSEALGAKVEWDPYSNAVVISNP